MAALAGAAFILTLSPLVAQNGKSSPNSTKKEKTDTSKKTVHKKTLPHGKYRFSIKP